MSDEMLQIEIADAWFTYLERTQELPRARYELMEPFAWSALQQRLSRLTRKAVAA